MRVPRHDGHEPGDSNRARSVKAYPHDLHAAGSTTRLSPWDFRERARCSRCAGTSRSEMPTAAESSLADDAAPSSPAARRASSSAARTL